jgi:hypothetical protein
MTKRILTTGKETAEMKATSISVKYGRTVNLGNYNSVHVEFVMCADVEDDDELATAAASLRQWVRIEVEEELHRYTREGSNEPAEEL